MSSRFDPTATPAGLAALSRVAATAPTRPLPLSIRLTCVPCGQRFSGSPKSPRVCPFCASGHLHEEAS